MLLFRSEEHIQHWCSKWHQPSGGRLSLRQVWGLANGWFGEDRRLPGWHRKTKDEAQALLTELALTGDFWRL